MCDNIGLVEERPLLEVDLFFKNSIATIDYIIADFSLNRITNKETYFMKCVSDRINLLSEEYNSRVEKVLNFIILNFSYTDYPLETIAKIIHSISKITNAVSRGILSLIER